MSQKKKDFNIQVPTKPYLKKYLEAQYGASITFSTKDPFGMLLYSTLENSVRSHDKAEVIKERFDRLDDAINIKAPLWWLQKYENGHTISQRQALAITKLLEAQFVQDVYRFCALLYLVGIEQKTAIEIFCDMHGITIEEEITFETIKKKEARFRKKVEEKTKENAAELSREGTKKLLKNFLVKSFRQIG